MDNVDFYLEDLKSKFSKINSAEYYLSYSGSRDSHFLYWFIKEYAHIEGIKVVGINTYMEHHEILERMKKNCDIILLPTLKPFEIKEKYGIPCFSKEQDCYIGRYQRAIEKGKTPSKTTLEKVNRTYKTGFYLSKKASELLLSNKLHKISEKCCMYLKKEPARKFEKETGLKPILAVRQEESSMRKRQYQSCFTKDKKFTPIYDLTDELLKEIEKKYNIEVPDVYNYVSRTGCMGCPYGSYKHDTEKELELINDKQREFVKEYFKESYKVLGIEIE